MSRAKPTRGLWLILLLVGAAFATGAILYVVNNQKVRSEYFVDFRDPELVRLGDEIYAQQCAECHGGNLEGQPNWKTPLETGGFPAPPHDETGHTWHHPDQVLFTITKYGGAAAVGESVVSNMPGFEEILSDREILAALAFIKSTWPVKIQDRQEKLTYRQTLADQR